MSAATATQRRLFECKVCFGSFGGTKIVQLPCHDGLSGHCCFDCAKKHFELKIKSVAAPSFTCPVCAAPKAGSSNKMLQDYFENLTIITIPSLKLSPMDLDLYHRKLDIDWVALGDDELFFCPNQNCSIPFMSAKETMPQCPHCRKIICGKCKNLVNDWHKMVGCERVLILKDRSGLNSLDDVSWKSSVCSCPGCNQMFLVERGGCDHMKCTVCRYEFCRTCSNLFAEDKSCPRYKQLKCNQGLHCHHPRNCWFYLRDENVENLQQLLRSASVQFKAEANCKMVEGCDIETAGTLYKEYLVNKIRKHGLDPVSMELVPTERLEVILKSEGLHIPSRGTLTEDEYRQTLRDAIAQQIPLPDYEQQR